MKAKACWRRLGWAMVLLVGAGCQGTQTWHGVEHLTMPVSGGMNLALSTDESITVVGVKDYGKCEVRAFYWIWAPTLAEAKQLAKEDLQLALVCDGRNVTVEVTKPSYWDVKTHRLSIRYAVMLPCDSNIHIVSTRGDVEVINMEGEFWVEATRGKGFCWGCGSSGTMKAGTVHPRGRHP